MRLQRVKPSSIKVPEIRVKGKFDEETKELLRKLLQGTGVISPIVVQKIDEDLVLVDGENRLEELKAAGDQLTDVAVIEGDMVDLYCRNLLLDHVRGKHQVGDMIRVLKALYQDHGLDSDQIEEKTGLPRDYIERLIKISSASPEVLTALDAGAIGVGVAYELARLPVPIVQEEILAKSTVYRLRVKDVKELVDATLQELDNIQVPPPAAAAGEPAPPPEYKCEGCGDKVDPRYLRPAMVCPDCFGAIWRLGKARKDAEVKVETAPGGD